MIFLEVSGIGKTLTGTAILKDISFLQQKNQQLAITGETGSGKTSLLKIMAGLLQPNSGKVLFENIPVAGPDDKLIPGHPGIAYLSQQYELRNNYRVEELLEYARQIPNEEAQALFKLCRISHLVKRKSDQLSGGERQRIALARLLVGLPRLLLLDEPFSNLDPIHKKLLKEVIQDLIKTNVVTCILTSHEPADTLSWADRILVLKAGQIIQDGTPYEIYHQPVNEYVAGLFGNYYLLDADDIKLFTGLPASRNHGKKLFVRPENFCLVSPEKQSASATITKLIFWGTYYEAVIQLPHKSISVKTMDTHLQEGDLVNISLSLEATWYL